MNTTIFSTGIWLFVTGLIIGWVNLADSRPMSVNPRGRQPVVPNSRMSNAGITTMKSLSTQKDIELENRVSMFSGQPDNILYIKRENKKKQIDEIEKAILDVNFIITDESMSKEKADALVKFFIDKVSIQNKPALERDMHTTIRKHPRVALSLQMLQEKIQNNEVQLSNGQYGIILMFVARLKEINPPPLTVDSKEVSTASVLLNLGAHIGEMVTRPDSATDAFSLIKMYVQERIGASGPAAALKSTLRSRGYITIAEQINWMKVYSKRLRKFVF